MARSDGEGGCAAGDCDYDYEHDYEHEHEHEREHEREHDCEHNHQHERDSAHEYQHDFGNELGSLRPRSNDLLECLPLLRCKNSPGHLAGRNCEFKSQLVVSVDGL